MSVYKFWIEREDQKVYQLEGVLKILKNQFPFSDVASRALGPNKSFSAERELSREDAELPLALQSLASMEIFSDITFRRNVAFSL